MFIEFGGKLINESFIQTIRAGEEKNDGNELFGYWISLKTNEWRAVEYFEIDKQNEWIERWEMIKNLLTKSGG